ncbi:MAG: hypothetical protein ISR65_18155 [Bacteriovoracaceae bacterium]|nr:hypothetical protein [Bacteriovoracaceae bacterium]
MESLTRTFKVQIILFLLTTSAFLQAQADESLPQLIRASQQFDANTTLEDLLTLPQEQLAQNFLNLQMQLMSRSEDSGGGWASNGGEHHLQKDNAWFLGASSISYCIERSSDFFFSKSQLQEMVREGFNEWRAFFSNYKLTRKLDMEGPKRKVSFKDGISRTVSTNFVEVPCQYDQQGQVKEIDGGVVFLFGKKNSTITNYHRVGNVEQLGVAIRKSYDHVNFQSTGFIWIDNFSAQRARMKHMVVHEQGHVFGMKHDSVFVMDEDVAYKVSDDNNFADDFFGKIESKAWKYRLLENVEYVVTANFGRKFLERAREVVAPRNQRPARTIAKCLNQDFMPNITIPKEARLLFRLRPRGCHKFTLKFTQGPRATKVKIYTLKMETLRGTSIVLKGKMFAPKIPPRESFAPGVFSEFKVQTHERTFLKWLRLLADHRSPELPIRGHFQHGNLPLATRITNRKGIFLEVFLPNSKKWWVLNNIHNRFLTKSL